MSTYADLVKSHPGLVSLWETLESAGTAAADSHGTNPGVYTGGFTLARQGPIAEVAGGAVEFNGTSGFIRVTDANPLDLSDGPFSYEIWVKRLATGTSMSLIGKGTGAPLLWMEGSGGGLALRKSGTGDVLLCAPVGSITDITDWHHVVVTRAAATRPLIYLDGADVTLGSAYSAGTFSSTATDLNVGASGGAGGTYLHGQVASPAVYNQVLTPAEILDHYVVGKSILFGDPAGYGVAVSATSFQVAAENEDRKRLILTNDDDTVIYGRLAASGAVVNSGFRVEPNGGWRSFDFYKGPVSAIVNSPTSKRLLVAEEV